MRDNPSLRWGIAVARISSWKRVHFVFSVASINTEIVKEPCCHNALLNGIWRESFTWSRRDFISWLRRYTSVEPVEVQINLLRTCFDKTRDIGCRERLHQVFQITCVGVNGFWLFLPLCLRLDKSTSNGMLGYLRIVLPLDFLQTTFPPLSLYY